MGSARTVPSSEPPMPAEPVPDEKEELGRLPIDRRIPYYPELYPRDPDAYEPLDHFYQRQKDPDRLLEREIQGRSAVRQTIIAGEKDENYDGTGVFVLPWDGIAYYVVVGFHVKGYRIAITGWPWLYDKEFALNSPKWDDMEVYAVKRFNEARNDDSQW